MGKWQPIDSAPVGQKVVVVDVYGSLSLAERHGERWVAVADGMFVKTTTSNTGSDWLMVYPTLWCALPEMP